MTQDDRPSEDILGLFRKFDGDAHAYKEFSAPIATAVVSVPLPVPVAVPVANGSHKGPALNGNHAEVQRTAAKTLPIAPQPVSGPAPNPASAPAPAVPPSTTPPTELERLFTRLSESTPLPASPMARWRRPT